MSNPVVIDPNDKNIPPKPAREVLWSSVVASYDPNHAYAQTQLAAYQFGHVYFYHKRNAYDDSEAMVGSQGGAIGSGGWLIK